MYIVVVFFVVYPEEHQSSSLFFALSSIGEINRSNEIQSDPWWILSLDWEDIDCLDGRSCCKEEMENGVFVWHVHDFFERNTRALYESTKPVNFSLAPSFSAVLFDGKKRKSCSEYIMTSSSSKSSKKGFFFINTITSRFLLLSSSSLIRSSYRDNFFSPLPSSFPCRRFDLNKNWGSLSLVFCCSLVVSNVDDISSVFLHRLRIFLAYYFDISIKQTRRLPPLTSFPACYSLLTFPPSDHYDQKQHKAEG